MTLTQLVTLSLVASIVLTVFAFGLGVGRKDTGFLVRQPARLAASLLSMHVVTPLVAAAIAVGFDLHPAVKVALLALSVSPISPLLPGKAFKAGGRLAYATGLFATTALLSVFFIPVTMEVVGFALGFPERVAPWQIARPVLLTVLVPLLMGFTTRMVAEDLAIRILAPVRLVATIALVASAIPLLVFVWPGFVSLVGDGTLLAFVAFATVSLVAGHLLGGSEREDRIVLALSSSGRHPGVAIAVATAAAPELRLATAAILLYLVVSAVTGSVYIAWTRQKRTAPLATGGPVPLAR